MGSLDERVAVNQVGTCRSCGARIVWGMTEHGTAIPLDPRVITIMDEAGRMHRGRESHFASCPHGAAHRSAPRQAGGRGSLARVCR